MAGPSRISQGRVTPSDFLVTTFALRREDELSWVHWVGKLAMRSPIIQVKHGFHSPVRVLHLCPDVQYTHSTGGASEVPQGGMFRI